MTPFEHKFAMKQLGLDPSTGRKLKPTFDHRARIQMTDKIMRIFAPEIKRLGFEKADIDRMVDQNKRGFKNSRMYFARHCGKTNYAAFIRIFGWINREILRYK